MANYSFEIEQLAAETRRRSAMLLDELDAVHRRTADKGRELAERSARELIPFWEEKVREAEAAADEAEQARAEAEERERAEAEERMERERQEAEAREQREAIARSIAARKSKDVVTPIDEDDDPESEYYRRKSWLI
ncbi:caldesmon [Nocardia amikacinitolerans]|uniref:Caldesmon n=1 Tax=Nocardia amikacinitolerans TaxID=756689 RepID=A0A285LSV7_9NOCA|nr:hypothetical protein [Nocardia amikacinitolerans]MCP2277108.1 hypothetical protein [Nocardia amikacinitolerans]MCP2295552.1 hypothetical protein [Nocardia amikacinitolerans]SNY88010.1 caldesmon [Nocardia amikacinitolerans]